VRLPGSILKKIVNTPLNAIGFSLVKLSSASSLPTWSDRIKHAKKLGFSPQVIVDGGAFTGQWSEEVALIFPGSQIVIIEPNPFVQQAIKGNTSGIQPTPKILNVALGQAPGKATLNIWREETSDTGASLLEHVSGAPNTSIVVDVNTLDDIAQQTGLKPDFIKLDLQGAELSALKGANPGIEIHRADDDRVRLPGGVR